jgi:hypothetical protein
LDQLCPNRRALFGRCAGFDLAQYRALSNHGLRAIDLGSESLRDIEATLGANPTKLYAMGLRQAVHRSTLADANERRDWRIWADFAAILIRRANKLYAYEPLAWM